MVEDQRRTRRWRRTFSLQDPRWKKPTERGHSIFIFSLAPSSLNFSHFSFFFGCRAAFVVVLFCPRHFRAACPVPVQKLLVVGRYPLAAVLQLARFLFGLIFSQPSPCCFLAASLPGRSIFFFFDVWSRAEKFQFDSAPTIVLFYFLQISAISCIRFAPFTSGAQ